MSTNDIRYYTLEPKNKTKPKSMVILLHGLGADGKDLMGLAPYMAEQLPDTVFVAPDAPFPCDMAPMGYQWFSLQDRSEKAMLEGVHNAQSVLNAFIDSQLEAFNLPDEKCALLGFSQGTMLSLYTAPRRENELAGVLGYSGMLIGGELLRDESQSKFPVHLVHGKLDDVVPFAVHKPAVDALTEAGFDVVGTTVCDTAYHNIDELGLSNGVRFLSEILNK